MIVKPLPCKQDYSQMLPASGGRVCTACGKVVVDFREKTFREIKKIHQAHPVPTCGVYSMFQIDQWNDELNKASSKKTNLIAAAVSALIVFANGDRVEAMQLKSQSQIERVVEVANKQKKKEITGTVITALTDSTKIPVVGAKVIMMIGNAEIKTTTDSAGRFRLDVTKRFRQMDKVVSLTVADSLLGQKSFKVKKDKLVPVTVELNPLLIQKSKIEKMEFKSSYYILQPEVKEEKQEVKAKKKWWKFWSRKEK